MRELIQATCVAEVAALLKRTALEAYPREEVASLYGAKWCEWLQTTSGIPAPPAVAEALSHGVYHGPHHTPDEQLQDFANDWVRDHAPPPPAKPS
ncbi:hypothetical protein MalM25_17440 [Planctomycetes bacterium MalM25]|nr:hypothetical protein MalM25_17440 [Planctomycetes bacterium MalM25]